MAASPKSGSKSDPGKTAFSHPLAVAELSRGRATAFDLVADAPARAAICAELGLAGLADLRFKGEIAPAARGQWRLSGRLTADLSQACVITLDPVPEKIDERVLRDFAPEDTAPAAEEVDLDLDADDDPDVFTDTIDPGAVALEMLVLALDPYPRKAGAAHEEQSYTAPGIAPLKDEDLKPFAGLAALRSKMSEGND